MTVEPVGRFGKDPQFEDFLSGLNDLLIAAHDHELRDAPGAPPTLHIIGAPRTGTTLLTQLVAAHLNVDYIDHIAASLWRAPLYGLRLSKQLLGDRRPTGYDSEYGRTRDVWEPHEFGYFWTEQLGYASMTIGEVRDDDIDWSRLRSTLRSMTSDRQRPIVFKSFLFGLHLSRAILEIPETCFVWMRRPVADTAMSLLRFREGFAGSRDSWVSLRPRDHAELSNLDNAEQVVRQVVEIERHLEHQIVLAGGSNVIQVDLADVSTKPREILASIVALLDDHGADVAIQTDPPKTLDRSGVAADLDPDLDAVRRAVERVVGE